MSDEELVRLAAVEGQNLTPESFHLLKAEFEARNLDLSIIQTVQTEKDLAEAVKMSEFEKTTSLQFTETIWQFAFDEKEKGKSNQEIYDALLKKNIDDKYAYMLIASIEPRAKELVKILDLKINIGWILTIVGSIFFLYALNSDEVQVPFFVFGTLMILGGVIRLAMSYSKKRKLQTTVSNIEIEKEAENNLYQ
jgi:hypothetical protein